MRAADLRATLGVSKSTIHRVLEPLLESGDIVRERRGVATSYSLRESTTVPCTPDPRWDVAEQLATREGRVTRGEMAIAVGVSERTSTRILQAAVAAGRLVEQGRGRNASYALPG